MNLHEANDKQALRTNAASICELFSSKKKICFFGDATSVSVRGHKSQTEEPKSPFLKKISAAEAAAGAEMLCSRWRESPAAEVRGKHNQRSVF